MPRKSQSKSQSVILRDLSIRESDTHMQVLSHFELKFWGFSYTRAGNFRCPTREAARYLMVRLRSEASQLEAFRRIGVQPKAANRLADKIEALLAD